MRRLLSLLFLLLTACGDGQDFRAAYIPAPDPDPPSEALHAPLILNIELSPDRSLSYWEGGGQAAVTAVLEVKDSGLDIETMRVEMSNGVVLTLDISGQVTDSTGTITQEFDVATTEVGALTIWFSLVDATGSRSPSVNAEYLVMGDPSIWIERSAELPNALNDVTSMAFPGAGMSYIGTTFVAVGDAGTIITSEDGINWTEQVSGTDVDLHAVFCGIWVFGCYAVGDAGTILHSANTLEWTLSYDGPDDVSLRAIYQDVFPSMALAGGTDALTDAAFLLHKAYVDDPWVEIELSGQGGRHITSIGAVQFDESDSQYIATLEVPVTEKGRILVSADGLSWVEVFISDGHDSTYSLEDHDGVWIGGNGGRVYSSPDGINWTLYQTPAIQSKLVAMISWNSMLIVHGFDPSAGMGEQVGVIAYTTSDGELSWHSFVIGSAYEPRGLAYGDGRWVSVGRSLAEPGRGAIFTTQ